MKKATVIILSIIMALCATLFAACSGADDFYQRFPSYAEMQGDNYQYEEIVEQPFVSTDEETSSYFSLDRNTASYSLMRRQIENGQKISAGSVRLEEYVNYFNYNYARPTGEDALALGGAVFDCPWNAQHKLLSISVAAEELKLDDTQRNNIVFLIDTSGSMYGDDRLGLIQQAFTMLLDSLASDDIISIVTYAGDSRVALDGELAANKLKIAKVIEDLEASGSTNGAGGLENAYRIAQKHFVEEGNNRVILATDGDFNVGVSSKAGLQELISEKRDSGIYLSVLGVGMTNTNDTTMETLARNGNGNYAYLDSIFEAKKVLVQELNGTLVTVAKDAKIGVEFNKEVVSKYRLLGYDTKLLTQEQFEDENTDAGEIGAGHTVTAVYEIELKTGADGAVQGNIAQVELKYKKPATSQTGGTEDNKSVSITFTTEDYTATPNNDCVFIGCVLEYGLILRQSKYKGEATFNAVLARLETLEDYLATDEFKQDFASIVQKASRLGYWS
ncbi:MAG: von Willebrand factor type A domain-containing protein [Clostridiales bacterium]|nr:von Willebrand factor type A domain-containing protein [Clostridiales bacterium]